MPARQKLQVMPLKPIVIEIDRRKKISTVKLIREIARVMMRGKESITIYELYRVARVTLGKKLKSEYVLSSLLSQKYIIDCETKTIWKATKD